jgi:hypothetical protein
MPQALALSVALAAIGLTAPAPTSAAQDREQVKTRVRITSVSSYIVGDDFGPPYAIYRVYGVVRSPRPECRRYRPKELIHHPSDWHAAGGEFRHFSLFWRDRTSPFTEEHDRVKVRRWTSRDWGEFHDAAPDGRFICKRDTSRRFTIPPPSEAEIEAVAPEPRMSFFRAGLHLGLLSG